MRGTHPSGQPAHLLLGPAPWSIPFEVSVIYSNNEFGYEAFAILGNYE